ncbi:MAG TPA: MqnA/MqnD/SBP family protein, partial [Thermomicrobiales bacterium]|nr:MqnA/MqnD/SBP family protein [Thermomicrobiales bacterium]
PRGMPLELLFDDAPGPAPLALAVELGWATLPAPLRATPDLTAEAVRAHPDALALIPVAEYALLQDDYLVLPELAAGGTRGAAAVLRADRRPDEIDRPLVKLDGASRTTECLARATLLKFYGITVAVWSRGDAPPDPAGADAAVERPVVEVLDGGAALHLQDEPGTAVVADLGRAWFILTGLPCVSHLTVARRDLLAAEPDAVRALLDALPAALAVAHERRRELRRELSRRYGVSRELLNDFYNDQFQTLTADAHKAAVALFARGAWGLNLPTVTRLTTWGVGRGA